MQIDYPEAESTGVSSINAAGDMDGTYFDSGLATADLNKDGSQDIISVSANNSVAQVFIGNGDGTFQAPTQFTTASCPIGVVVGDFNDDGKLDVATSTVSGVASVLLGNGDGTFGDHHDYSVGDDQTDYLYQAES